MFATMRGTLEDTHINIHVHVCQSQYKGEKMRPREGRVDVRREGEGLIFVLPPLHLTLFPELYELASLSPVVSVQHVIPTAI